jgi:serpin B
MSRPTFLDPAARPLAADSNAFAIRLHRALRTDGSDNLFVSPYSIATALAMTRVGAAGETAAELTQLLCPSVPAEDVDMAYMSLTELLGSERDVRLAVANRIWGPLDEVFRDEFLALLTRCYGASLERLDFADADAARATINGWIATRTQGKISELIPPGLPAAATRLLLTNAVYFKGRWHEPFDPGSTRPAPFHCQRDTIDVPTMQRRGTYPYARVPGAQLLEMPYRGEQIAALVVLPDARDGLAGLEEALDGALLARWTQALAPALTDLSLPRFKAASAFELRHALADLGVRAPFGAGADFSGMNGRRDLFIASVLHQAVVEVNEEGTEAAAATAVMMARKAAPPKVIPFVVDRPFLFAIRDRRTGVLLFLGRVGDPRA